MVKISNTQSKNCALVIIDMQNDFCSEKGAYAKAGFTINNLKKMAPRLVIFLKEFRKLGIPIIFIQAIYDKKYLPQNIYERYVKNKLEKLCQSRSWGADFYNIKPLGKDVVFIKHRYDAFSNPEFILWLKKNTIHTLILAGCTTDVCVDSTARSAFMEGFNIIAVEDCLASNTKEDHERALDFYKKYYDASIITSKDLLSNFNN